MRIGLGLAITNNQKAGPSDVTAPTVAITLSQYTFKIGDTATATFTFSEAPTSFTEADVTAPNGSLSSFGVTGDPLVYTAIFTPDTDVTDPTNVITVGTGWTDAAGNPPAGATTSDNYTVDTTAPTVVITANASTITAAAFTATITFTNPATGLPEAVTGFVLGDITVSANAGAGTFVEVSDGVYTAVITPTATGTVTVDVGAGVCTDAGGNANAAATQFSILYVAASLWYDFSDIATLWQDTARTSPITADGQTIAGVTDKSPVGKHASQATAANRPLYKTNIQNALSVANFVDSTDLLTWSPIADGDATVFIAGENFTASSDIFLNSAGSSARFGLNTGGADFRAVHYDGATNVAKSKAATLANQFVVEMAYDASPRGMEMALNGVAATGTDTLGMSNSIGKIKTMQYCYEVIFCAVLLDASQRTLIRNYLNTKWSVF